ncbi:MAG TPA: STAS domain-containing protein [Bryobacteraceae bacterium]|nr:STAS domain-containing protein [Bryobacteraceae bacterium]
MGLSTEKTGGVVTVTLAGETLDAGNSKEFKAEVAAFLTPQAKVVFDMSRLRFVDSSGLGAILSCLRQLNGVGGDLKLCAMTKPVRALFELVRMHRVFEIFNTREEAIRSFGG